MASEQKTLVDPIASLDEYLSRADWRVNANANQGYSLGGMILNSSGKMTANYWLSHIYPEAIGEAHRNGDIHIHDLDMLSGYCAGWSLRRFLEEGLNGISGQISSGPPKHFSTALGQAVNFLGTMQNEWAGAQAFSSFDTYLAPYVREDKLSYEQVKQEIQSFIYNLNVPSRWGSQCPFTNLTFDWTCPNDLKNDVPLVGGKEVSYTYGDLQHEMDIINKAYIEVMLKGDDHGRVFTFPIPTYNIVPEFDWDCENAELLFELTGKYGLPYFQNFLNSDLKPNMVRSMCPVRADTPVFVRSRGKKHVRVMPIGDIWKYDSKGIKYDVWTGSSWKPADFVRTPMTDMIKVTMSNGLSVTLGSEHLQPVLQNVDEGTLKTVTADKIKIGDFIPYNKTPFLEEKSLGDYELGYVIGAYIGDGSQFEDIITYSLNETTKSDMFEKLSAYWEKLGYESYKKGTSLKIYGNSFRFMSRFVNNETALKKNITQLVFSLSYETKKGIFDGLLDSDGAKEKRRLYTSSEDLKNNLIQLAASIGIKARIGFEDNREGRLGENTNYRIDLPNRKNYGMFFNEDESYNYFSVTSLENVSARDQERFLYCASLDDGKHLFALANGMITHNCRLQLDLTELLKRGNGLFGSGEQTGSIGVVTLNCARLGYLARGNMDDLLARIDYLMDIGKDSLEIKRQVITKFMDGGLFPYTKRYLGTLRNHFSTLGVNGINEMVRNFTHDEEDITTPVGREIALSVLDHIRSKMKIYQSETGHMYNLEATPAEGTTYRFAREDKKRFSDIVQAGTEENNYYTNSSQLPVGYTDDPFEALEEQEAFQQRYTGGTVLHLYTNERISSAAICKKLVRRSLENFKLPYITVTPTFSICPKHGYLEGEHEFCPKCDAELVAKKQLAA